MSRDASYAEVDTFYLRIGFGSYSGRDISFCRGNGGWTYKLNIEWKVFYEFILKFKYLNILFCIIVSSCNDKRNQFMTALVSNQLAINIGGSKFTKLINF